LELASKPRMYFGVYATFQIPSPLSVGMVLVLTRLLVELLMKGTPQSELTKDPKAGVGDINEVSSHCLHYSSLTIHIHIYNEQS